ncbi:pentapeptide repeat-containing protein [Streptomyces arboris]|uniref:pentapeptide repeat-containing protein n=1 Tax=Streptomyces arboris TaxID=2600619 RepID=UPI00298F40EA|nr:pentapeptide repeat-containing protein [Streptomyces arboris]
MAHLNEADRVAYLSTLAPGSRIDLRGTPLTQELLNRLFDALRSRSTDPPHFGEALFEEAYFSDDVQFDYVSFLESVEFDEAVFFGGASFVGAEFSGFARFDQAKFSGYTRFVDTVFSKYAGFREVSFLDDVEFDRAIFLSAAHFTKATFSGYGGFLGAVFTDDAQFDLAKFSVDTKFLAATFSADAGFSGSIFAGEAHFHRVRFEATSGLGPLVCAGAVYLDHAVFSAPVTIEVAAKEVSLQRTRWESTVTLRLRYAEVNLAGAVLDFPITLAAERAPLNDYWDNAVSEELLEGQDAGVRLITLAGVDAGHLALTDVDLSDCRFTGTVHLDQLRMEGRTAFAQPPVGWRRRGLVPLKWSRRHTLAEEHYWRAAVHGQTGTGGWRPATHPLDLKRTSGPETIAAAYRQLRKALEDGKNEPGAADFYYGECEMRRHDRSGTPWAERVLLRIYWAVSGYGLRASRALGWLLAAMAATVLVMMLWGIPKDAPKPTSAGTLAGHHITVITDTPDPVNPTGSWRERLSSERFEKSLQVVINSVVFRSSGHDLTTAGTYAEMASRFTEPALLGLAILAVRGRVKR